MNRMNDTVFRQDVIDALNVGKELLSCSLDNMDIVGNYRERLEWGLGLIESCIEDIKDIPSAQAEDYTELKRDFLQMASYIDVLLECSDTQKETLMGFISRLAEYMPWTKRD